IVSQTGIGCLRIVLCLKLFFIDSHKFLAAAGIFSKTIVRDPIQPGGKTCFAAKTANVFVGSEERLLRQIVREGNICPSKLTKQTAHRGLMSSNQLTECMLVVIDKNSREEVRISQLHIRRLRYRRRIVFLCIQLPYKQIPYSNQEWDEPEGPRATLPIVHGAEERHQADTDHCQDNTTAQIRTLPLSRWWIQQCLGHRLSFFDHHANRLLKSARSRETEIHNQPDDQNRRPKDS